MKVSFNSLPWHDAELLDISIDRRNPGGNDQVTIEVCWPDGQRGTLIFENCYGFEAKMNFGILAPESILDASSTKMSQELATIKEKWAQMGVDLAPLQCFEIRTNSTASILRVYALGFYLNP